jgi:hypothetical protein
MRTKQKDITNGESAGLYVAYADAFMCTCPGDSATLQERSLQLPRPGKVTRKKKHMLLKMDILLSYEK